MGGDIHEKQTHSQDDSDIELLLQPKTETMSLEQLEVDVRIILARVAFAEERCKSAVRDKLQSNNNASASQEQNSKADYQGYVALYKALLNEYHDLCLTSQYHTASAELRLLPKNLLVPARIWHYTIHSPLEVLRAMLPESREHMIGLFLFTFNIITLFLETVPIFRGIFPEFLGDLSRYRLEIAENYEECQHFRGIARYWYDRAIDQNPLSGRLLCYQATLAPYLSVERLSLYGRALIHVQPSRIARKSILSLLLPVYFNPEQSITESPDGMFKYLRAHASLFFGDPTAPAVLKDSVDKLRCGFFGSFVDDTASRKLSLTKLITFIAFANLAALFEYGATRGNGTSRSFLRLALLQQRLGVKLGRIEHSRQPKALLRTKELTEMHTSLAEKEYDASRLNIRLASSLAFSMLNDALQRPKNINLHPLIHVTLVLIWTIIRCPTAFAELETYIRWDYIAHFLDSYASPVTMTNQICKHKFPNLRKDIKLPLPEDWMLRGSFIATGYLPSDWCKRPDLDDQERILETDQVTALRIERMLWIGWKIASYSKWLLYEEMTHEFKAGVFTSAPSPERRHTI